MYGAFYDHYTIRQITGHNTMLIQNSTMNTNDFNIFFRDNITKYTLKNNLIDLPQAASIATQGLLFIPGHPRIAEDLHTRDKFERKLLTIARKRGQPVLAICAGCWNLWQHFKGIIGSVEHHCYSRTPNIKKNGDVGYNVGIHRVNVTPNTMLHKLMPIEQVTEFIVNSVHWQAPVGTVPDQLIISATTIRDNDISIKMRAGCLMEPDPGTIEAFETIHGVPMMGIQWHPEAYYPATDIHGQFSSNIVLYMVQAGDAYLCKRR